MDKRVTELIAQFFADCQQDNRSPNEENLRGWLWFTCPANLRIDVGERIKSDPRFQPAQST